MTDTLVQFGVSNLLVSLVLAIGAWCVHRSCTRPYLAHLLWVLVLAKLVTPPMFTLPLLPIPGGDPIADLPTIVPVETGPTLESIAPSVLAETTSFKARSFVDVGTSDVLIATWLIGSVIILVWSFVRIVRFDRALRATSSPSPAHIERMALDLARRLGIRRTPIIRVTTAHVSPMVWWVGGRVRVVIPAQLVGAIGTEHLRWVLAHELAHVRRRDHVVRWLEWLACVGFWWNPVSWIARRYLRISEEICCDALVLATFENTRRPYASALMAVVEFLSAPAVRPPAVASEINSGGYLERRFRMIVSKNNVTRTPRWLQAGVLVGAMGILPVGFAYGQDFDAIGKRLGEAVLNGELSKDHARAMMQALKQSARADPQPAAQSQSESIAERVPEGYITGEGGVYVEYADERKKARRQHQAVEEQLALTYDRAVQSAQRQLVTESERGLSDGAHELALLRLTRAAEAERKAAIEAYARLRASNNQDQNHGVNIDVNPLVNDQNEAVALAIRAALTNGYTNGYMEPSEDSERLGVARKLAEAHARKLVTDAYAKQLARHLDDAGKNPVTVIPLMYTDAGEVGEVVTSFLHRAKTAGIKVSVDASTNSLLVGGDADAVAMVEMMAKHLDRRDAGAHDRVQSQDGAARVEKIKSELDRLKVELEHAVNQGAMSRQEADERMREAAVRMKERQGQHRLK